MQLILRISIMGKRVNCSECGAKHKKSQQAGHVRQSVRRSIPHITWAAQWNITCRCLPQQYWGLLGEYGLPGVVPLSLSLLIELMTLLSSLVGIHAELILKFPMCMLVFYFCHQYISCRGFCSLLKKLKKHPSINFNIIKPIVLMLLTNGGDFFHRQPIF